jgi:hypothetical protein
MKNKLLIVNGGGFIGSDNIEFLTEPPLLIPGQLENRVDQEFTTRQYSDEEILPLYPTGLCLDCD